MGNLDHFLDGKYKSDCPFYNPGMARCGSSNKSFGWCEYCPFSSSDPEDKKKAPIRKKAGKGIFRSGHLKNRTSRSRRKKNTIKNQGITIKLYNLDIDKKKKWKDKNEIE